MSGKFGQCSASVLLRKENLRANEVSTTCGSGWVIPANSTLDPPATAGGTDFITLATINKLTSENWIEGQ